MNKSQGLRNSAFHTDQTPDGEQNTDSESPPVDNPIEVPIEALSADALRGVIEEFILREGTDYGLVETSHATKISQVERQLKKGEIKLVYDPDSETVTLIGR